MTIRKLIVFQVYYRKKKQVSTQKFGYPAYIKLYNLAITKTHFEHNHEILQDTTIYSIRRKQEPEVTDTIYNVLSEGLKIP